MASVKGTGPEAVSQERLGEFFRRTSVLCLEADALSLGRCRLLADLDMCGVRLTPPLSLCICPSAPRRSETQKDQIQQKSVQGAHRGL